MKHEVSVSAGANILVHYVPIKVLELLRGEVYAGHLIWLVIWGVEAIAVVKIDWCVWMPRPVARYFDLGSRQCDFMEDSSNRERIFFDGFGRQGRNNWLVALNWSTAARSYRWLWLLLRQYNELESLNEKGLKMKSAKKFRFGLPELVVVIPTPWKLPLLTKASFERLGVSWNLWIEVQSLNSDFIKTVLNSHQHWHPPAAACRSTEHSRCLGIACQESNPSLWEDTLESSATSNPHLSAAR